MVNHFLTTMALASEFESTVVGVHRTVMAQDVEVPDRATSLINSQAVDYTWLDRVKEFSPPTLLSIGVVTLAFLAFFTFLGYRALQSPYTLLFSGLETADAQDIVSRLEAMNVPFKLSDRGDAILVPGDRALRLRMTLAEEGMPGGAVVGYEIFDQSDAFGTTDFLSNLNLKRALEGELSRTISAMRDVRSARVHLVQPERVLFQRTQTSPTASVFLSLRRAGDLPQRSIAAIRHLVAAAVPGLDPAQIAVLDDNGTLLARSGDGNDPTMVLEDTEQHRHAFEERLRTKIVALLERSVGPGRADAMVTAELDYDEITTTQEIFDPDGQVARSVQTVEEEADLNERDPQNDVGVANNLPNPDGQDGDAATTQENTARTEETVNYEISRTVRNQLRRGGGIQRISIAVQVDGRYETADDGTITYLPRNQDELDDLETLIRSAAGLSDERGDTISILNRQFVQPDLGPEIEEPFLGLQHADYLRLSEIGMIALVALLVLFLGIRPLINRIKLTVPKEVDGKQMALIRGEDGRPMVIKAAAGKAIAFDEQGVPIAIAEDALTQLEADEEAAREEEEVEKVDLAQIEGKVKASLLNDVAGFVEKRPDDAVRVLRGWLQMD